MSRNGSFCKLGGVAYFVVLVHEGSYSGSTVEARKLEHGRPPKKETQRTSSFVYVHSQKIRGIHPMFCRLLESVYEFWNLA